MFMFLHFTITTLIVFIFSNYLNFIYLFDIYKQWFFNDINDFQLYDFIVGMFIYVNKFIYFKNIIIYIYINKFV